MKAIFTSLLSLLIVTALSQNTSPFPTSGYVGIGTTTPFNHLHIQGTENNHGNRLFFNIENLDNSAWSSGAALLSAGTGTNKAWTQLSVTGHSYEAHQNGDNVRGGSSCLVASDELWIISGVANQSTGGSKISFFTNRQGGNYLERAYFEPSGAFHIRAASVVDKALVVRDYTTDQEAFRVYGDGLVEARRLRLSATIWMDKVFDPEYKLMPLETLEQYIKKHKHLPEVPSEEEVLKDGLDVANTDAVLLQKIEELTLHMIEMNKTVQELKAKNAKLEAQLEKLK